MTPAQIRVLRRQQKQQQSIQVLPPWFVNAKSFKVFTYDTQRYPFKELMADWLEITSESLAAIHTLPLQESKSLLHPKICQAWKAASMPKLSQEARKYDTATQKAFHQSPAYHRFMDTYRRFIKEIIAHPDLGLDMGVKLKKSVIKNFQVENII